MLSLLIFSPLAGAVPVLFIPRERVKWIRGIAVAGSALPVLLLLPLMHDFSFLIKGYQMVERVSWIPAFGIDYFVGVDGLSLPLVILTAVLGFLSVIASRDIGEYVKEYYFLILLLISSVLGVFLSLDFVLFYIFWEAVLIPMYFLIGIHGGPQRKYAAFKFFTFTFFGSALMLIGVLTAFHFGAIPDFAIDSFYNLNLDPSIGLFIFVTLLIGFGVKTPLFPFHTWLPDAHVEAPTAASVLLAGVLLKMGAYGFLRLAIPMLPDMFVKAGPFLFGLACINIIYGASLAIAQTDLKKLVAYSSINHMGFITLGIFALNKTSISGAIFQMFAHGIITGMLFLLVGEFYRRTHTRSMDKLGGLYNQVPVLSGILVFTAFASLGLPALAGFVGEFLILTGATARFGLPVILAAAGVLLNAVYLLRMLSHVLGGKAHARYKNLEDIDVTGVITTAPLIVFILFLGIYPAPFFEITGKAVDTLLRLVMH